MRSATVHSRVTELVSQHCRATDTPGVGVAVTIDGKMALAGGIGSRDLRGHEPLPDDARFYIYSITKTLLAALTLQLVERDRIGLDLPVQEYLTDYPLTTPMTVRQVLNHTAGLPDYGGMPEYSAAVRANPERAWSSDDFLERTLVRGLQFPPGDRWSYSNIGYLTIKLLVERVTNLTLRDLVSRQIVEPLGLVATTVAETLDDTGGLTPGFSGWIDPDGPVVDVSPRYHPGWVSHGVVISTAPELAQIIDALFDGGLVAPDLLPQMLAPVRVPFDHPLFSEPSYGLGMMIDPGSVYGVVAGHGGGGPGYSTGTLHFPDVGGRRITTVALANSDRGDVGLAIASGLANALAESSENSAS